MALQFGTGTPPPGTHRSTDPSGQPLWKDAGVAGQGVPAAPARAGLGTMPRHEWDAGRALAEKVEALDSPGMIAAAEGRAAADVEASYGRAREGFQRELGRYGLNPGSGKFASGLRGLALGKAASKAGARTMARTGEMDRGLQARFAHAGMDLERYKTDTADATQRYGIDTGAETARRGQDVQRYGIDTGAETARRGQDVQRYGIDIGERQSARADATQRYGIDIGEGQSVRDANLRKYLGDLSSATSRYGVDVGANTQRYGIDRESDTRRYLGDLSSATSRYGIDTDFELRKYLGDLSSATSRYGVDVGERASKYSADKGLEAAKFAAASRGSSGGDSFWKNVGTIGGIVAGWSDRRLKTNVEQTGALPNGIPVYRFNYIDDLETTYTGVMADEVATVMPQHVGEIDGFLIVDYAGLLRDSMGAA